MAWQIKCLDRTCQKGISAANIVDLIRDHTDPAGWIMCRCGHRGYVEKVFDLQEPGETWEPFLKAVIPLGNVGDSYQPFVFLVGNDPHGPVDAIQFSYYKDLRPAGRLKLGHGPGGPPVLSTVQVCDLVTRLKALADAEPGTISGCDH